MALVPSALVATVPATAVVPCLSAKVVGLSGAIAESKEAEIRALSATPVAPSEGALELSDGGCGGGCVAVLPPQAKAASDNKKSPGRVELTADE